MEKKQKYWLIGIIVVAIVALSPLLISKGVIFQGLLCFLIGAAGITAGLLLKNKIVRNIAIAFLVLTLVGGGIFFLILANSNM